MSLHHALRDLHASRGIGLAMEDADELRASLDDYLTEGDASVGEVNLLVDAVRLGGAARMIALVAAGGDVEAAIRESGAALARDRGSDDVPRACWALAALGFAIGRVPEPTLRRYPRHSTLPLPPTIAPSTTGVDATVLPGLATPGPVAGGWEVATSPPPPPPEPPTAPTPVAHHSLPPTGWPPPPPAPPQSQQPTEVVPLHYGAPAPSPPGPPRRRRPLLVGALVLVLLLGIAAGASYLVLAPDDAPRPAAEGDPPPPPDEPLVRATPGVVLDAPGVDVPAAPRPIAMGSATGGVRLAGFGVVDSVTRGEDDLVAPEGGRLVAFRLADWAGCESAPCRPWARLDLRVEVGGRTRVLPSGGPTFVVALPPGARAAELVYRDPTDGFRQSLSLGSGGPSGENITVLARPPGERTVRIGERFRVVDSYTPPLPGLTDAELTRFVRVRSAELFFSDDRRRLRDPGRAYLRVDADFNSPVDPVRYRFREELLSFTGADGTSYPAIDLDPGEGAEDRDVVFEVPGSLRAGRLTIGGTYTAEAGYSGGVGVTITITVPRRTVRIAFGS